MYCMGLCPPLNHVTPKDLTIDLLIDKIKKEKTEEVILALDADMEGDITALYIR